MSIHKQGGVLIWGGGVLKWVCGMGCETEVAREWNVGTLTMNKLSGVAETLVARMWQGSGKKVGISDFV